MIKRVVILLLISISCEALSLETDFLETNNKILVYGNTIAFGYGPSPQNILTYLPSGQGNNFRDWLAWAKKYRINHVRSYPPSIIVRKPAVNLFITDSKNMRKYDLNQFNADYFNELKTATQAFRESGLFVHLQLWQAVAWKKQWNRNYYNPKNNVNPEISLNAGPAEFSTLKNPALLEHQKEYVRNILDATAHLGNVYYDVMNEIGNGTKANVDWVIEIFKTINEWEKKNNIDVLITINDEGGMRLGDANNILKNIDFIIKDLGRWDEHVETQKMYNKPTVSVRNIDWNYNNKKRRYFYGEYNLEINTDQNFQIRGRKYWWRMFMAKVQMAGGYADAYDQSRPSKYVRKLYRLLERLGLKQMNVNSMTTSYALNTLAEDNFFIFRNFIDFVKDFPNLVPHGNIVSGHPAAHNYSLLSKRETVIYLESPNGDAGYSYAETDIVLSGLLLDNGSYTGFYYFPDNAEKMDFNIMVLNGSAKLTVPSFHDDLAIYIH